MPGTMWGLDIAQIEEFADSVEREKDALEALRNRTSRGVTTFEGAGPDIERFRVSWGEVLEPSVRAVLEALTEAVAAIRRHAEEQREASDVTGGNGSPGKGDEVSSSDEDDRSFWDKITDGASSLWEDVTEGVDAVIDTVRDGAKFLGGGPLDGLDWFSEGIRKGREILDRVGHELSAGWDKLTGHVSKVIDSLGNVKTWAQIYAGNFSQLLTEGRWPRITEVAASALGLAGAVAGTSFTALTGIEQNIFNDGKPVVKSRSDWERHEYPSGGTGPASLSDLVHDVTQTYRSQSSTGDPVVRVTRIENPGEEPTYIVSIPGTQTWNPNAGNNPLDLTGNLATASGEVSTGCQAVEMAMAEAGIPDGAQVMLVGHSQGGMIAANLASDPGFMGRNNVTSVMTVGSPIENSAIDPRVNVLSIAHDSDLVPKLDINGVGRPTFSGPGSKLDWFR